MGETWFNAAVWSLGVWFISNMLEQPLSSTFRLERVSVCLSQTELTTWLRIPDDCSPDSDRHYTLILIAMPWRLPRHSVRHFFVSNVSCTFPSPSSGSLKHILNGSDHFVWHTGLLDYWSLSFVQYCKRQLRPQCFGNQTFSFLRWRRWETPIQLIKLERVSPNPGLGTLHSRQLYGI
jgi:hypothetical protein